MQKKIDVWVHQDEFNEGIFFVRKTKISNAFIMAVLTIDVHEPTREITPTIITNAFKKITKTPALDTVRDELITEIFGDTE